METRFAWVAAGGTRGSSTRICASTHKQLWSDGAYNAVGSHAYGIARNHKKVLRELAPGIATARLGMRQFVSAAGIIEELGTARERLTPPIVILDQRTNE
jgi:hypothetical protein